MGGSILLAPLVYLHYFSKSLQDINISGYNGSCESRAIEQHYKYLKSLYTKKLIMGGSILLAPLVYLHYFSKSLQDINILWIMVACLIFYGLPSGFVNRLSKGSKSK